MGRQVAMGKVLRVRVVRQCRGSVQAHLFETQPTREPRSPPLVAPTPWPSHPACPPLPLSLPPLQIYRACKAWQKLPSAAEEADQRIKLAKRQAAQEARAAAREQSQQGTAGGAGVVVGAYTTKRAAIASMNVQLQPQQVKAEAAGRAAAGLAAGAGAGPSSCLLYTSRRG